MMTEAEFEKLSKMEMAALLEALDELDPDLVDVDSAGGVLNVTIADGPVIVINSHRAALQIWMAAVDTAWHFDPKEEGWLDNKSGNKLRPVLAQIIKTHTDLELSFS